MLFGHEALGMNYQRLTSGSCWVVIGGDATVAQPAPDGTDMDMIVGTGDAKEMPPGLAEEMAERRIGDNDEVRCGDLMGPHDSRRLCGDCSRPRGASETELEFAMRWRGCGELLESWPRAGWEDRAVERAKREGVLP